MGEVFLMVNFLPKRRTLAVLKIEIDRQSARSVPKILRFFAAAWINSLYNTPENSLHLLVPSIFTEHRVC